MSDNTEFNDAAEKVKTLTSTPNNDEMLKLYSLFKQATVGDCNTSRPGMLDLKGKAKWDSWDKLKGMAKEEAEKDYIAHVDFLMETYKKK